MKTLYHVTKEEKASQIWESGIRYEPPEEEWVEERREMRVLMDEVGNRVHKNWINRQKAVFFWTTHSRAIRYAERFLEPAIVEVNVSKPCWCLSNTELENLYDDFRSDEENTHIERLVRMARQWNGERNNGIEVWTDSPIQSENIHQIYNINGDIFEIN